jgi:hypothetical protein
MQGSQACASTNIASKAIETPDARRIFGVFPNLGAQLTAKSPEIKAKQTDRDVPYFRSGMLKTERRLNGEMGNRHNSSPLEREFHWPSNRGVRLDSAIRVPVRFCDLRRTVAKLWKYEH